MPTVLQRGDPPQDKTAQQKQHDRPQGRELRTSLHEAAAVAGSPPCRPLTTGVPEAIGPAWAPGPPPLPHPGSQPLSTLVSLSR